MQAFRSRYQKFGRSHALPGALAERCITRSNSNLPGNIETFRRSFSRKKYLLRQRTNRCNPDCSQTAILWFVWMVSKEFEKDRHQQRVGLTAAGWRIHQSTVTGQI